ncbi:hypothetical protein GQ607_007382 [Colletotrichum asianum]|uniref:Uncharacterized protein n=1 Tax=Colletotrichum asianum TaxID=702518 RepID=A0A8H3WC98_9PEZI|nr:hypothetical protein GQ607_007382 [Colletotrichum asianum]
MSLPFPGLFSRTDLLVKPHAPQISLTPKPHFARGQAGLLNNHLTYQRATLHCSGVITGLPGDVQGSKHSRLLFSIYNDIVG